MGKEVGEIPGLHTANVWKDCGFGNLMKNGKNVVVPKILVPKLVSRESVSGFKHEPVASVRDFGTEDDVADGRIFQSRSARL